MERISEEMFVREMSILWQNSEVRVRNRLAKIIRDYYDCGERATLIINRMQETIEAVIKPVESGDGCIVTLPDGSKARVMP